MGGSEFVYDSIDLKKEADHTYILLNGWKIKKQH